MPAATSPAEAVLASLGWAVFRPQEGGALQPAAAVPAWLRSLWPAVGSDAPFRPGEDSPFLENFLLDAGEAWARGEAARAESGAWVERAASGEEVQLEASAVTLQGQPLLLLRHLAAGFDGRQPILQKARETGLLLERLQAETEKKQILLHCIAEDMNAALANVVLSLRLMESEENSARMRQLIALALLGAGTQRTLIDRVLAAYSTELQGLYGRDCDGLAAVDLRTLALEAVAESAEAFARKGVRLEAPRAPGFSTRVCADAQHAGRVLSCLLAHALGATPAGGRVVVELAEEEDAIAARVLDGGAPLDRQIRERLFGPLDATCASDEAIFLRFHFCRIAVEGCGGEIGCTAPPGGGNCFWIRLPKAVA